MSFRATHDVTVHVARNRRGSLTIDVDPETAAFLRARASGARQKYVLETLAGAGRRFSIKRARTGRELQATNRWEFPGDWGASLIDDAWPPTWTRRPAVDGQMDENGTVRFTLPKIRDCLGKMSRTRPQPKASPSIFVPVTEGIERPQELPLPKPAIPHLDQRFASPPRRTLWQFVADLFRDERS